MPIKSEDTIRQDLKTAANEARSGMNLQDFEVLDSSFFRPLAGEDFKISVIQEFLRRMFSFDGMRSLINDTSFHELLARAYGVNTPEALSVIEFTIVEFAASFGVLRSPPIKASGFVRFINPTNVPITVGLNKRVATVQRPQRNYLTTASVDAVLPIFDPERAHFFISVPVEAEEAGTIGNVAAEKINNIVDSDITASFVLNVDAVNGGLEIQPVLEVIDDFEQVFRGITLNTDAGYANFSRQQTDVISVYAAKEQDPLFTREFSAGAIDLWVLVNQRLFQGIDTFEWQEIIAVSEIVESAVVDMDVGGDPLDVNEILFQSGTTVRYTFNDDPDLTFIEDGMLLDVVGSTNPSNDGLFIISAVDNINNFIEVTNPARTDSSDDESSDSPSVAVPFTLDPTLGKFTVNFGSIENLLRGFTAEDKMTDFVRVGVEVELRGFVSVTDMNGIFTVSEVGENFVILIGVPPVTPSSLGDIRLNLQFMEYAFVKQPVSAITLVRKVDDVPLTPFNLPKLGFELVKDEESLSRSAKGNDRIKFRIDTFAPGDRVQIQYFFNSVIVNLQNLIESVENNVTGSDVLYRNAIPRKLSLTISAVYVDSSERDTVNSRVEDDVSVFFNGGTTSNGVEFTNKGIGGATFQITDLLNLILDVEGIDALTTLANFGEDRLGITIDGAKYSDDRTIVGINVSTSPSLEITLANNENFEFFEVIFI